MECGTPTDIKRRTRVFPTSLVKSLLLATSASTATMSTIPTGAFSPSIEGGNVASVTRSDGIVDINYYVDYDSYGFLVAHDLFQPHLASQFKW